MSQPAYSLAGTLTMKTLGGALTVLRPRKKCYFALDEMGNRLLYFKDEADFVKRNQPLGEISLDHAAFTLSEGSPNTFIVHYAGRRLELEAANESSTECWLEALARRVGERPSAGAPDNDEQGEGRTRRKSSRCLTRRPAGHRSRSHSLPSDNEFWLIRHSSGLHFQRQFTVDVATLRRARIRSESGMNEAHQAQFLQNELLPVFAESLENLPANWRKGGVVEATNGVPPWLNDVHQWLQQQPFLQNVQTSDSTNKSNEEPPEASTETSVYNSKDCSTASSDIMEYDELHRLRVIDNRQKARIHALCSERKILQQQLQLVKQRKDTDLAAMNLKFLNEQVLKLNQNCIEAERQVQELTNAVEVAQEEALQNRREYVFLLQSCIRMPIHENSSCDVVQVKLFGGDVV